MIYAFTPPDSIDCPRCSPVTYHVHQEDMSNEGHMALWYAMALIGGKGSRADRAFKKGAAEALKAGKSVGDVTSDLQKGLRELLDKGLLDAERNGEGGLTPTTLHLERLAEQGPFTLA